jgi:hypothetical protein
MTQQWFVVNARDAQWLHNELGAYCPFEGVVTIASLASAST